AWPVQHSLRCPRPRPRAPSPLLPSPAFSFLPPPLQRIAPTAASIAPDPRQAILPPAGTVKMKELAQGGERISVKFNDHPHPAEDVGASLALALADGVIFCVDGSPL